MSWGQALAGCPRIFTNHTDLIRIREIRVNSWTVTSGQTGLAMGEDLKIEGGAERFRVSTGDGGGFRVARRARSWPSARGADGFRGRGRRPPGGRGPGASRGHETALCAVHESLRARDAKASEPVVETRKRFALFSTCHEVEDSRKAADFGRIEG